jgi:hypothetical protein
MFLNFFQESWSRLEVSVELVQKASRGRLMRFHEGGDRFLTTLRADFQVVAIVRQRLMAPLTPSDLRRLHLRYFFE